MPNFLGTLRADVGTEKNVRARVSFGGSGNHDKLFTLRSPCSQVPLVPIMVLPSTSAEPPRSTITQPRHITEVRPCAHVYGRCAKNVNERVYGS